MAAKTPKPLGLVQIALGLRDGSVDRETLTPSVLKRAEELEGHIVMGGSDAHISKAMKGSTRFGRVHPRSR